MNQPSTNALLNHLLAILCRSFPQYLKYSRPYVPPGRGALMETINAIVSDQNGLIERIGHLLEDAHTAARRGEFPMEFTDLHDLSIDFLIGSAISYQEQDIAKISELVEQLRLAPAAQSLAEEALGMAKGHLDSLRELLPAAASS